MLIVPVRYQARPVGLIILHGQGPESFHQDEVEVIQSLAAQAGVALGDAYLFESKQQQDELKLRQAKLFDQLQ